MVLMLPVAKGRLPCSAKPRLATRLRVPRSAAAGRSASSQATLPPWPLEVSRQLARARMHETQRQQPLFQDTRAASLAVTVTLGPDGGDGGAAVRREDFERDIVATQYIDEMLLRAVSSTSLNTIAEGDYRQVVLLGDGLDTRPFRLFWPEGTMFFVVAPAEVHDLAEALLRQGPDPAVVPQGCLLRRVKADLQRAGGGWALPLARAGFRADRVSVWALQGVASLQLPPQQLDALLADVADSTAYGSLVFGELPPMLRADACNCLAESGLLAGLRLPGDVGGDYGRMAAAAGAGDGEAAESRDGVAAAGGGGVGVLGGDAVAVEGVQRWLFSSQQRRLSLQQADIYEQHVADAEYVDEDMGDTFFS